VNNKVIMMLLVALVMAGGAAFVANKWLARRVAGAEDAQIGMVSVAAAAVAIPFGQKIELAHIKMVELLEKSVPPGVYMTAEEVAGMIASVSILAGELLTQGRVVEHLGGSTLAAVLKPGMRAVSVRVNEIIGVAGFLLPGNRVDVLASRKAGKTLSISTILHNINVLAVAQTASTDKNEPVLVRSVTLEVTPQQAEELVKATLEGKVQLALRNPKDDVAAAVASAAPAPAAQVVQIPAEQGEQAYFTPKITMIRGTGVSTIQVDR
jgi:pilus assembly protein CpaB